jgi:transposase, IS30 family
MHTRSSRHLSTEARETLSLGLSQGYSLRAMASVLGRAPSTVSREVARNTTGGRPSRACTAQSHAAARTRQPRRPRKLLDPWLWQYVQTQLTQGCSPEQIAGRLRSTYPDDMRNHLSAETLYAGLYVLPRGALRTELLAALRQAHKARRPRARGRDRRGQIPNMTPIAERPAEVDTRMVPGHWEGDLLKGARNGSAVGTLVERTTAWSSWPGWTGRMPHVPARALPRNSGMCPPCCGKP